MGIAGVTYGEFLYQSMNKPFVVGLTYLQSSTSNQVLETLTLIQKDVNGNESQKTLVPTIDPYQQQSTIIAVKFSYKIDGFTSVVISRVLASTTAKVYFYPAETSSIARTLVGQRAVAGYGNPNIIKSDKVVLSGKALRALRR
jgi:tricorn protease-like protein